MKTAYNHLTHSYETPDKTTVAAEICEGDSPSDAFRATAIREQQRKSAAYARTVIDALYENSDPVSIDAAELLESLSKAQPQQEPVGEIGKIVMFGGDLKEVSWKNGKMPPVGTVLYTSLPAQQELVAWATQMGEYAHIHWGAKRPEYPVRYEVPLYASPPTLSLAQRQSRSDVKPLTDEEIDKAWRSCDYTVPWEQHRIDLARAIEAAHGITKE